MMIPWFPLQIYLLTRLLSFLVMIPLQAVKIVSLPLALMKRLHPHHQATQKIHRFKKVHRNQKIYTKPR